MKTVKSLDALLASFGPNGLRTGAQLLDAQRSHDQRQQFLTRVDAFDELLCGLRRGTLIEVVGSGSSGKFSLELAVLAAATDSNEPTALVDLGDNFDPHLAVEAGVQLSRLLWLRPARFSDALKSTEIVLSAGFRVVVLDLGVQPINEQTTEAVWMRFAREAEAHDSIVLVVTPTTIGSAAAAATIETSHESASWIAPSSRWRLFNGLSVGLRVLRRRGGFEQRHNHLSLPTLASS